MTKKPRVRCLNQGAASVSFGDADTCFRRLALGSVCAMLDPEFSVVPMTKQNKLPIMVGPFSLRCRFLCGANLARAFFSPVSTALCAPVVLGPLGPGWTPVSLLSLGLVHGSSLGKFGVSRGTPPVGMIQ